MMISFQIALRIIIFVSLCWLFATFELLSFFSSRRTVIEAPQPNTTENLRCNLSANATDAWSAIERATLTRCKTELRELGCRLQQTSGRLHAPTLPHSCPSTESAARYVGCFRDFQNPKRVLSGYYGRLPKNNPHSCQLVCFRQGFALAGLEYGHECHCGNRLGDGGRRPLVLPPAECNETCPGDDRYHCGGWWKVSVYTTGLRHVNYTHIMIPSDSTGDRTVRLLYILMLNGRSLRQTQRLLRVIYRPQHYYYIHVDERKNYLHEKLKELLEHIPNIAVTDQRSSTIWGGTSLLTSYLRAFKEIFRTHSGWKWDYLINYSETDFPLLPVESLVDLLSANYGSNFLRSHHIVPDKFYRKQGFNFAFWECGAHLYRVGKRSLPWGLWYDGGSDWFVLHRDLVNYATYAKDDLVSGLKNVFSHAILPAESFFHTLVRNSKFCATFKDSNLKLTNWKRGVGCKCQHKAVVDWCGCSPKVFELNDTRRLERVEVKRRNLYTGRKFESIIDLDVINWLEIFNLKVDRRLVEHSSWNLYWHSIFDPKSDPEPTEAQTAFARSLTLMALRTLGTEIPVGCIEGFVPTDQWVVASHGSIRIIQSFTLPSCQGTALQVLVDRRPQQNEGHQFLSLEVGTNFDLKEYRFREYLGIVHGPPTLRFEWTAGHAPDPLPKAEAYWLDPNGQLSATSALPNSLVGHISPNSSNALTPGVWTVRIRHSSFQLPPLYRTRLLATYHQTSAATP